MTQAVTELVVDGSGALSVLGQYERGMERAGQATERSTGALSRFEASMQRAREAQEKGLAIQTESIQRRSAEQRALERWQGHVDKTMRRELQLRREAERAAVDMSNAVVLGYTTQEQATATLVALEQRHAAELRQLAGATNAAGAANDNLRTRVDAATRSLQRQKAAAGAGTFQTANIAAQFQDIAVTSAMGMSPLQIALQQGTQLSAVLNTMQNPVKGLAAAFMSVINPVSLVTIGVIAAGAALIQYFSSGEKEVDNIDAALRAHADNIADIKARWGDAASGVTEYAAKSRDLIRAESLETGDRLREQIDALAQSILEDGDLIRTTVPEMVAELEKLEQAFVLETDQSTLEGMYVEIQKLSEAIQNANKETLVAGDRFGLVKDELDAFAESVRAGEADFIGLQNALARRKLADPANEELRRIIRTINELGDEEKKLIATGADLQRSLEGNATALDKIAVSARNGAKGLEEFADARERLIKLAVAPMSDRQIAAAQLDAMLKLAKGIDDVVLAYADYEAAIKRIEDREAGAAVPIPTPRPNDIQRLDWEDEALDKQASAYDRVVESARNRIEQMQLEIEVVGKAGIEADALRLQLDLLQKAQKDGATVTPEQRAEIEKLTASYRELATELAKLQALDEIDFARSLIGLSDGDKQIVSALRQWGLDANTEQGRVVAGQIRVNQVMQETQDELDQMAEIGKDAFMSILDLLYETGDIGDKLIGIFANIGKEFAKLGMEKLWKQISGEGASIFGAGTAPAAPSPVQTQQMGREIGNAIAPSITSSLNENLTSFAAAIRKIESGSYEGNYGARGKVLTSGSYAGDRAYGAYQVMGNNIASWTKEVLGHSLTISEFVADRAAQDKVFFSKFGASLDKFGNFADATSVWFSGRPLNRAGNSSDGYNTVPQYVQKAQGALDNYPGGLKGGVSDGMVDASRRIASTAQTAADAAPQGSGGLQGLFAGGNMQKLMAGAGAFAGGLQSGDPLGGALSGGLGMLGAGAGPLGIIGGAVLGLIGGLIGRARQKRQELKQAQQELEQQMGAITELIATATGNFMGTFEKTVMQTADEFSKAIAMANKAKNVELVKELEEAQDEFFDRMTDRWERGFEGMIASMEAGLGMDGEFMAGMDAVEKMREQLVGFVNDARLFADAEGDLASVIKNRKARFQEEEKMYEYQAEYNGGRADAGALTIQNALVEGYRALGDQIIKFGVQAYTSTGAALYDTLDGLKAAAIAAGLAIDDLGVVTEAAVDPNAALADQVERAQKAAQATALAMISGAEEFTAMEEAVQKLRGTVSNMETLLTDLGMSADEAATAIDLHLNIAMAKLRDAYRDELNASINDLSGFGFLNEIVDAMDRYDERLKDSAVLGLDASLATRELNLALADIVDTADLTQAQIDMLAEAFPAMAGLMETVAGQDAIQMVRDAEAALRSAYEEQRREIEATISRLENFTDRIKEFRDEMRLSASSPLGQRDQMEEALRQFRETALAAQGEGEDAIAAQDKLTSVSQSALDEARAYYASSEKYADIWREIDATLADVESKAGRQLSEAQQQLEALDRQVGALIDINDSVLSVADAIAALAGAQSARDKALQDQINAAKNAGAETRTAEIAALYQSILGRTGSSSEIGWWAGTTKSIDTIRLDMEWAKQHGSYATGGYTGDLARNAIAGVVHGQEFVMNAEATRRWRPQFEAMNAGHMPGNDNRALESALRQEIGALTAEVKSLKAVVAAGANATVGAVKEGNAEMAEVSTELKRANSR